MKSSQEDRTQTRPNPRRRPTPAGCMTDTCANSCVGLSELFLLDHSLEPEPAPVCTVLVMSENNTTSVSALRGLITDAYGAIDDLEYCEAGATITEEGRVEVFKKVVGANNMIWIVVISGVIYMVYLKFASVQADKDRIDKDKDRAHELAMISAIQVAVAKAGGSADHLVRALSDNLEKTGALVEDIEKKALPTSVGSEASTSA